MRSMTMLLRLMRFSPGSFAMFTFFNVLGEFGLPITIGFTIRAVFDSLSGASVGLNLWTAIALLVALRLANLVVGPGSPSFTYWWSRSLWTIRTLVQRNLIAGILRGYGRHGLPVSAAETISRFRDDPQELVDALDALNDLIARVIFAGVAAYVMWQLNAMITVALFVPILLSGFVTKVLNTKTGKYHAASREAAGRLTGFLGELLAAQLAVKVAGAAPPVLGRLNEMGEVRRRAAVRNTVFGQLLASISTHSVHLGTGLVLLLGARAIQNGTFTVGDFALFVIYLDYLRYLPEEIGRLITDLKQVEVSTGRMQELIPGEPAGALGSPAPVYLYGALPDLPGPQPRDRLDHLEVRDLSYHHATNGPGIVAVSFALRRGTFTVVTGAIGAGKTTLLHALLGLVPKDAGEILWNGRLVGDPATFFVPPRSAYTPQQPRLFSETLRENILLGHPDSASALDDAVHAAVLEQDVASLDRSLDTLIGPRGVKLSGGQVQRTAAARMFVREAELLIFDDLSSALDTETESELWSRLFAREVTCLAVTHRPAALRRADQILLMDHGRLIAQGTLEDLLANSADMRARWQHELTHRSDD